MRGLGSSQRRGDERAPARAAIAAVALFAWGASLWGCARNASPRSTLEAVQAAAARNDADALYALLPRATQRALTREQFRARLAAERPELQALATELRQTLAANRGPIAELATSDGAGVTAVEDREGWHVARAGVGPGTLATPLDAARALRSALRRRSLAGLLQVLSARARGALLGDLEALEEALSDPSNLRVGEEQATVPLPDGRELTLVREGGSWRVQDLDF